jgi:hypothetical protein
MSHLTNTNPYVVEPRVEPLLGTDIDWSPASNRYKDLTSGNLEVTTSGDFALISGVDLVAQSRIKELMTPIGMYAAITEDINGVGVLDADYGNPAYSYLSEPTNTLPLQQIADACREIMLKDARVTNATARPNLDTNSGVLFVLVEFSILDGSSGSLSVSLNT